jgi:hypothetical protein
VVTQGRSGWTDGNPRARNSWVLNRGNRDLPDPKGDTLWSVEETFFQKTVVSRTGVGLTDLVLTNAAANNVAGFINRAG